MKARTGKKPVADLDVGDEVRVSFGPETFSPIRYHTFTVGPIAAATKVREGETADDAYTRVWGTLAVLFETQYATVLEQFLDRVREVHAHVARAKA